MRYHMKIVKKIIIPILIIGTVCLHGETVKSPGKIHYKQYLKEYKAEKDALQNDHNMSKKGSEAITLNELLQSALLNNPELKFFAWDVEGKDALVLQSRKMSNPELETELENAGIDAFSISIGQLIELGGKRSSRIALAKLDKNASVWEYEIKRLQLLVESGQQFILTLQSQQLIDLLSKSIEYAEKSFQTAQERIEAGAASQIDIFQTQKDLELTVLEHEKALNHYDLQLNLLATYTGDMQHSFSYVSGELKEPQSIPSFDNMVAKISQSPDMTAWMIRSEMLKVMEKNAKAQGVPDVSVSAGYARENATGSNTFLMGFSLPLPLFDRNKGNVTETRINTYRSLFEKQVLELKIYQEFLEKYTQFKNTFEEVHTYSRSILPLAGATYKEAQLFYTTGRISSMELLNYQRELLENEKYYIDLVSEFYLLKYDLELLIGSEIRIETGE